MGERTVSTIIDPPGGWKYGFPKPIPSQILHHEPSFISWLKEQGYPEKDIPLALKHSRYWERDDVAENDRMERMMGRFTP